ncbi:hypothetical protein [Blastococcus sp. PRF04-17]|uniref:hypothetical protein n=1 Tax=Blastococcus sp. PRF04-17 TaxID=2933797 RepID=UPI001FF125E3|nr:hypothetical protein [Blastococcus sp. PRF04-17]UOX99855.1 hypothetical protein MVA48_12505 [Blastococcus sp. PRF04-17]
MDPQTRAALDGYQAGALRWLAGGVIAVVLGVLLGVATVAVVSSSGQRYPAVGLVVVALVFVGLVAIAAGAGALLRTVRWRRALQRTVWQYGRLRIAGPAIIAFEPAGYDELDPDDEPVRLKLLSTAVWRTRAVQALDGAEVRAAPVGDRQWVITADGLETVYGAGVVTRSR